MLFYVVFYYLSRDTRAQSSKSMHLTLVFTVIVVSMNILRTRMLVYGEVMGGTMFFVFFTHPNAVIDGNEIVKTILKALKTENNY